MEAIEYKCPNCDADLKFDPESQKLSCEFCLSSFTEDELKKINEAYGETTPTEAEIQTQNEFEEHTNLYHCASCGAQIMCDDQQTALFCYYCHNPVILSGKLTGDYKPSKLIPFKFTKDRALETFRNWVQKKTFLPDDFKSEQQLDKLTGLYVPFWIADCNVKADFTAVGKNNRSWTSGNYRYTETKEYNVVRRGNITVNGIPADGESKIEDLLMESIEPFNYDELQPFSMTYLTGFYADKYDVDKAQVFPRIQTRASQAGKKVIRDSIGSYSSLAVSSEQYNILKTDWEYMMLPVWFMTYNYNNKIYEFAINGQTGKLAGTPPLDKAKLRMFCTALGIGITAAIYLLGGLLFG